MKKSITLFAMLGLLAFAGKAQTADTVATPVVTLTSGVDAGNDFYGGPIEFTVTSATPGAQIYYTTATGTAKTPDTTATLYTGPISVAPGKKNSYTHNYKFIAVKPSGDTLISSAVVSKSFKVLQNVPTLADFYTTNNGNYMLYTGKATVNLRLVINGSGSNYPMTRTYLSDETGSAVIYGSKDKQGEMAPGTIVTPFSYNRTTTYGANVPFMNTDGTGLAISASGESVQAPAAQVITTAEVTSANLAKFVEIKNVTIPANHTSGNFKITDEVGTATGAMGLSNYSKAAMAKVTDATKKYNIFGYIHPDQTKKNSSVLFNVYDVEQVPDTVATPTVAITGGTYIGDDTYAGPVTITVTTPDTAATIHYVNSSKTPDATSTAYAEPIVVNPADKNSYKHTYAFISTVPSGDSVLVSKVVRVNVNVAEEVKTLADFYTATSSNYKAYTGNATVMLRLVTASNASNTYLADSTGYAYMIGSKDKQGAMGRGAVLKPFTFVRTTTYGNKVPYLTTDGTDAVKLDSVPDATAEIPEWEVVNSQQVSTNLLGHWVEIKNVTLPVGHTSGNFHITDSLGYVPGSMGMAQLSKDAMAKVTDASLKYNLYGAVTPVMSRNSNRVEVRVYDVEVASSGVNEVNVDKDVRVKVVGNTITIDGLRTVAVYNFAGALVGKGTSIDVAPGLYIVVGGGKATKVIVK